MMLWNSNRGIRAISWRGWLATALATLVVGCAQLGAIFSPTAPFVSGEWAELLQEVRTYERRIGFVDTDNFADLTQDYDATYFCGVASRLVLPYSYDDPAISWTEPESEAECRERGRDADTQSKNARAAIAYYMQLETLYARYARGEISADALLQEGAPIFRAAEKSLGWTKGDLNNVALANDMTYSRHYPFLESVFDALGRDLPRTIAFFRHVDKIKPHPDSLMNKLRLEPNSVTFVHAYEAGVIEAIRKALPDAEG